MKRTGWEEFLIVLEHAGVELLLVIVTGLAFCCAIVLAIWWSLCAF